MDWATAAAGGFGLGLGLAIGVLVAKWIGRALNTVGNHDHDDRTD